MTNLFFICIFGLFIGFGDCLAGRNNYNLACGVRPKFYRQQRNDLNNKTIIMPSTSPSSSSSVVNDQIRYRQSKIIAGEITKEGHFPWQVSLELLHPSLGFLGHWCGGVLIDKDWIISAAHCVHNELFNLPLPALWTAVLGEYNRKIESGDEQRISVEKIVMHKRYQNFQHDLVLMKLTRSATITPLSNIRKICLPFISTHHDIDEYETIQPSATIYDDDLDTYPDLSASNEENYLRKLRSIALNDAAREAPLNMNKIITNKFLTFLNSTAASNGRTGKRLVSSRRRNDKFFQEKNGYNRRTDNAYGYLLKTGGGSGEYSAKFKNYNRDEDIQYTDCIATGWGKSNMNGDLTDVLLKAKVPIHSNSKCDVTYGGFVKIHKGHLCAGRLDGKGGTCVGDSGGPLQCRLSQTSPWILVGVTSFGSGCALRGYPDVYTRISSYMKWITETMAQNDDDDDDTKDWRY